jgi:hypothetical protein
MAGRLRRRAASVDVVTSLLRDLQQRLGGQPGADLEPELAVMTAVEACIARPAGVRRPLRPRRPPRRHRQRSLQPRRTTIPS